jgi:hypothetical protein
MVAPQFSQRGFAAMVARARATGGTAYRLEKFLRSVPCQQILRGFKFEIERSSSSSTDGR